MNLIDWRARIRAIALSLLAAGLSGCGLEIPNASDYLSRCESYMPDKPSDAVASVYFISSALPYCEDGQAELTGFRNLPEQFGSAHYPSADSVSKLEPVIEFNRGDMRRKAWFDTLQEEVDEAEGKLIVFIHGYNNSFTEAFRRGADISKLYCEAKPNCEKAKAPPVVVIHWPSRASVVSYTFDGASIAWAQDAIDQRLAELTTLADDITIVAHSMGTRAAIRSVIGLDRIKKVKFPAYPDAKAVNPDAIKRIVLASGDVDRDAVLRHGGSVDLMMKRKPWEIGVEASPRRDVLIYSSYRDSAIQASRRVSAYARLGTTSCRYDISQPNRELGTEGNCHRTSRRPGLAVVSTSTVDEPGRLNHSDFLDNCSTRAHLRAWLLDTSTRVHLKSLSSDDSLHGYEVIPGSAVCSDRQG